MAAQANLSEGEPYYQWLHLRFDWKKQCENEPELIQKIVDDFFEPAIFFGEGAQTAKTQFALGTSYLDGRRYVLLSEPVALQLRSLLTKLLNHKYILTEPKAHSHTYYDLEFVVFESKKTYFKTTDKLKNLNKVIKKQERLNSFQCQWGRASHLVSERAHVFLSVDVEAYEHNHSCLLEIGWTLFDSRRQLLQDQHYLISDYRNLSNGTYVADRKRNFMFGTSVWSTLKEALRELNRDLEWAVRRDGGIILVGHDLKSDIDYLNKAGIAWPWAESSSEDFMQQFDTAEIYAAKTGNPNNKTGLGKSLDDLGIDNWCLHNAGNDAHYTMELFLKLCELAPQTTETVRN